MNWKSSDKYLKRLIKESGGGEGSVDLYMHNILIDSSSIIGGNTVSYVTLSFITKDYNQYTLNELITLFETLGPSNLVCNGYIMDTEYTESGTEIKYGPIIKCSYFDDGNVKGIEFYFITNFNSENNRVFKIYEYDFSQLQITDNVMPMVSI